MISSAAFSYIMHEEIEIGMEKIQAFLQLMDPQKQGIINYKDFLDLLSDPELLMAEKDYTQNNTLIEGEEEDGHSEDHSQAGKIL